MFLRKERWRAQVPPMQAAPTAAPADPPLAPVYVKTTCEF
jgi:hypothetical protein